MLSGCLGKSWGGLEAVFGSSSDPPLLAALGAILAALKSILAALGQILAAPGKFWELSWKPNIDVFYCFYEVVVHIASFDQKAHLGTIVGCFWAVLRLSWAVFGRSWAVSGRSWAVTGRSWAVLGRLRPSWADLGRS